MTASPKQTILVVDDTPENIDILSGILRPKYRVQATLNGERALKIAKSAAPPDLILLGIHRGTAGRGGGGAGGGGGRLASIVRVHGGG
jgi:CheY-like chemotaxis protein